MELCQLKCQFWALHGRFCRLGHRSPLSKSVVSYTHLLFCHFRSAYLGKIAMFLHFQPYLSHQVKKAISSLWSSSSNSALQITSILLLLNCIPSSNGFSGCLKTNTGYSVYICVTVFLKFS